MIQLYHKFYPHSGMVLQINTLVHCLFFIYGQKKCIGRIFKISIKSDKAYFAFIIGIILKNKSLV